MNILIHRILCVNSVVALPVEAWRLDLNTLLIQALVLGLLVKAWPVREVEQTNEGSKS